MEPTSLQLGLNTFGDVYPDPSTGRTKSHAEVLRDLLAEARLADSLGLDFYGVGEHHREDFAVSAPEVVLAVIAGQTDRIHLGSAVTVLSSDDPVRVFQRFSTLDAVSGGRAEVILGRGSFTESFPLFGYRLEDYSLLFEEKLELFVKLREAGWGEASPVTWSGQTRAPLSEQRVHPPVADRPLPTWIGVGGSPESVVRAARYGLPLMIAIIGGSFRQFEPFVELYLRALDELGQEPQPVGTHSPGHIADTDEQAREELWPHYQALYTRIGRERGWPPPTRLQFDAQCSADGALYVGSPETVARKIVETSRTLRLSRFDLKHSHGTLGHEQLMRSIELYGTRVREIVGNQLAGS